jgi:hypothetical protein
MDGKSRQLVATLEVVEIKQTEAIVSVKSHRPLLSFPYRIE